MTVTLTEEEWVRLLNAAALAPYAQIAPVLNRVMQQLESIKQGTAPMGRQRQLAMAEWKMPDQNEEQ